MKEAAARIRINKLLEAAGWRFFSDDKGVHVNIGSEKACLFIFMSNRLLDRLIEFPLLYDAVEESLVSAQVGYYSIGIIVWHDLLCHVLHASSHDDTVSRNVPAHDILKVRPTKESYDELLEKFKQEARNQYYREKSKCDDHEAYVVGLSKKWATFIDGGMRKG